MFTLAYSFWFPCMKVVWGQCVFCVSFNAFFFFLTMFHQICVQLCLILLSSWYQTLCVLVNTVFWRIFLNFSSFCPLSFSLLLLLLELFFSFFFRFFYNVNLFCAIFCITSVVLASYTLFPHAFVLQFLSSLFST